MKRIFPILFFTLFLLLPGNVRSQEVTATGPDGQLTVKSLYKQWRAAVLSDIQ